MEQLSGKGQSWLEAEFQQTFLCAILSENKYNLHHTKFLGRPRIIMVNIIIIYMHICKCIQYTYDDDFYIEEFHHQVQLGEK